MAQFEPGMSGNPRGRPKGARNVSTQFLAEVNAPARNGKPMTKLQAAIKAHVEKAVEGDIRAIRDVLERMEKIEADRSSARVAAFTESDREVIADIYRRIAAPAPIAADTNAPGAPPQ